MEEAEDYFGDISVPLDETNEDAANDLTFGDIGDIKAGDDSDAAWKSDHVSLSERIQAEKEALRHKAATRDRQPAPDKQFPPFVFPSLNLLAEEPRPPQPLPENPRVAWNQLQHDLNRSNEQPVQSHLSAQRISQLLQPGPPPPQVPRQVPMHMHPSLQPLQQQQPLQSHMPLRPGLTPLAGHRPQIPARSQAAIQDYQRRLMTHQDQQTRLLLRQHQETADKQLQEAQRAQQAGITFDRKEFDRHQEGTRQRILLDHHSRLRHSQMLVWQMTQQVIQQSAERPIEQTPVLDLRRRVDPASPPHAGYARSPVDSFFPAMASLGEPAVNASMRPNGRDQARGSAHVEGQQSSIISAPRMPKLSDAELQKAPRLQEIERQMAAAGLGPNSKNTDRDTFGSPVRRTERSPQAQVKKTSQRRLESMTDRDQEWVFRAHLRQIETSVVYKDDYYNSVLTKKLRESNPDIYADLAERVEALRVRDKERGAYGNSMRIRGSKRGNAGKDDSQLASSAHHSDQNTRALANALGTVQSWHPRAPRRVMDFGLLEKRDTADGLPQKSLRDDERVHVRQEIERGYDIIATIHDIARGESHKSLGPTIQTLMSTLHLAEKMGDEDRGERDGVRSTRFFATMCVIEKGRRYLSHVLELVEDGDKVRAMCAIFENLGMLVFASRKSSGKATIGGSQKGLFAIMMKIVQDPDIRAQDCLAIFNSFSTSHVPHRDAFLTTFRSGVGAKIVFLCMQRISAGLAMHVIGEEDISASGIDGFTQGFTEALPDVFKGAESESRVWEAMASLDALSRGDTRATYRSELHRLMLAGTVPNPPPS